MSEEKLALWIDYTNCRGERRKRWIEPLELYFGSNQWHPDPQWLLKAVDRSTGEHRTFAMKGIHAWDISV